MPLPTPILVVKEKDKPDERRIDIKPNEDIKIGRADDNTIKIEDSKISRNHCIITKVDMGYKIVDLETTNGTKVNGQLVNQAILNDGDVILLGSAEITFLCSLYRRPDTGIRGPDTVHDNKEGADKKKEGTAIIKKDFVKRPEMQQAMEEEREKKILTTVIVVGILVIVAVFLFAVVPSLFKPSLDETNSNDILNRIEAVVPSDPDKADKMLTENLQQGTIVAKHTKRVIAIQEHIKSERDKRRYEEEQKVLQQFEDLKKEIGACDDLAQLDSLETRASAFKGKGPTESQVNDTLAWIGKKRSLIATKYVARTIEEIRQKTTEDNPDIPAMLDKLAGMREPFKWNPELYSQINDEYDRTIQLAQELIRRKIAFADDAASRKDLKSAKSILEDALKTSGNGKYKELQPEVESIKSRLDKMK